MNPNPLISIVSPVYNAEEILDTLIDRIKKSLNTITDNYEIILVDDRGPDRSWEKIKQHAARDNRIKGLKLSRNFGQQYAIAAGLDAAKGEWIVIMDCDLQDQPEEIIKLYAKALEGYDIVLAQRFERKDSFLKRTFSAFFYKVLSYLTGTKQDSSIANFGLYNRKVISVICEMQENSRYFPTMVQWVGFDQTSINVEHAKRPSGKSSYNFRRLFNLALDIILANSDKPIRLTVKFGLFISFSAFIFALYNIFLYIIGRVPVVGYTSLVVSIWLLAGIIISILGIIGLYLGKTFDGVKARPIYIIDEKTNEN